MTRPFLIEHIFLANINHYTSVFINHGIHLQPTQSHSHTRARAHTDTDTPIEAMKQPLTENMSLRQSYIMTSKSSYLRQSKVCHDVKKFMLTSQSSP